MFLNHHPILKAGPFLITLGPEVRDYRCVVVYFSISLSKNITETRLLPPPPQPRCPRIVFVDKPSYYQPFFRRKMLATRESGISLVHDFLKNALKNSFFLARTKQATSRC